MKRVDSLLFDYRSFHRTRGNLVCHAIGITLILFGTLSMLSAVRLGAPHAPARLSVAEPLILAASLFYLSLNVPLALCLFLELALLDLAARSIGDWRVGLAAFLIGWVFQGIGHARYEKNSPAFFKNLLHLLVGPLFLVNELLRVRRPLAAPPG